MSTAAVKSFGEPPRRVVFVGVYEAVREARDAIKAVGGEIDDELVVTFPSAVEHKHALELVAKLGVAVGKLVEIEASRGRLS